MRFLSIGVLAAGVAMTACSGGAAAPPAGAPAGASPAAAAVGTTPAETEITIPAGTAIPIVLETEVGSATSRVEEPVLAHVDQDVMVNGMAAIPDGTTVHGVVTAAERSGRVKGRAHIAMSFDSVAPAGRDPYTIHAAGISRTAESTKAKKDALEIGGGAVGGAIIGGLIGGKKGAVIGTATGGAAGTGVALSTRGEEVSLSAGAHLSLRLTEPLTVRVKSS